MLKNRNRILALLIVLLMLALNVSTVFAARPLAIHIEVTETIAGGVEPFVASGTAVTNGLVCAAGTVEEISGTVNDTNGPYTHIKVTKRFDCGSSGTFDVRLVVKLKKATGETTAKWKVVAGTGNYASLKGNGKLVGTPVLLGVTIFDVYDGKLH